MAAVAAAAAALLVASPRVPVAFVPELCSTMCSAAEERTPGGRSRHDITNNRPTSI
jgi:hypothetical protein